MNPSWQAKVGGIIFHKHHFYFLFSFCFGGGGGVKTVKQTSELSQLYSQSLYG